MARLDSVISTIGCEISVDYAVSPLFCIFASCKDTVEMLHAMV